jgi:hypothetical protein
MDQNEMINLYRGPSIDASYQVAILVSDWLISRKFSTLKQLGQMDQNVVGSIYGRSSMGIAHSVLIR